MQNKFQIKISKSGKPTIKLNSLYIHSKYDPEKEGKQIAKSISITNKKCLVIFGLGLGYHITPYLNDKLLKIIVIEKYPQLVDIIKKLNTIKPNKNINIFTQKIQNLKYYLNNTINEYESDSIQILYHNPSCSLDTNYYNKAKDILSNVQKMKLQSYLTTLAFSKRWHENILKNIKYIKTLYTLPKQKLNIPIFIIASGPSLNNNINILDKIQKKGIIIALAPVYHLLKQKNINPHFLISIDAGIANRIHLRNTDMNKQNKLCLITTMSATPHLLRNWTGKTLIINHKLPSENIMISGFPQIPMQGSVSISAFNIAKLISKGDIYLVGFDFALTQEQYHYKGNRIEEIMIYSQSKIQTLDTNIYTLINKFQISKVKAIDNSYINTNSAMQSYLNHLEEEINKSSNTVFNLNSKGAYIRGTKEVSIKEINKLKNTKINTNSIITKISTENYKNSKQQINKILNYYIEIKKLIERKKDKLTIEELHLYINKMPSDFKAVFNFSQSRILKKISKLSFDPENKEDILNSINRTINLLKKN